MSLKFQAIPTNVVRRLQAGGVDANGLAATVVISDGGRNPCRHCLTEIGRGKKMLVLSHRPFPAPQPFAETGPIFLCADPCDRHPDTNALPDMFQGWEQCLIRGYTSDHWILYGTGQIVDMKDVERVSEHIFADPGVAYLHMRSASYNCYQCRIERHP